MKKRYINPEVNALQVELQELLEGSPIVKMANESKPADAQGEVLSRKSIWDDLDDEE